MIDVEVVGEVATARSRPVTRRGSEVVMRDNLRAVCLVRAIVNEVYRCIWRCLLMKFDELVLRSMMLVDDGVL